MPETPDLNQLLEAGRQFGTMTRAEAERRVQVLVRRGELAQERFQAVVDELLERSRGAADELRDAVRAELRRQVHALGLVTRGDLERLEARLRAGRDRPDSTTKKTAKKTAAKKSAAKRSAAKKTPGKKTVTKRSTAKRSTAKRSAAKKSMTKRSAAKKAPAERTGRGSA